MSKILLQKKQRFPQGCAFGSKSYKCRLFKRTNWCCFILVLCLMWRGSSVSGFGRQSPKRILDWPSDCFVERFEQLHTRNFSTHQRSEIAASYVSPSIDFSLDDDKTIFHLSSGVGRAGVAVIRVSGDRSFDIFKSMTSRKNLPKPRLASMCNLYEPSSNKALDMGVLTLLFEGPQSFTGEDVIEFHVHGNAVVVDSVLTALDNQNGLRRANPGEFTRRAFENGKIDLTEVEGLADLLNATTEMQRSLALNQVGGEMKSVLSKWRNDLLRCLAYVEAVMDFGEDESDVREDEVLKHVYPSLQTLSAEISSHIDDKRGEIIREGLSLAIVGPPNAGKSSLLNYLVKRNAALVSEIPGTTRDVIEVALDINGIPFRVSDTAGIRRTSDIIEKEGVQRAHEVRSSADIVCFVFDGSTKPIVDSEMVDLFNQSNSSSSNLAIFNKRDLLDSDPDMTSKSDKEILQLFHSHLLSKRPSEEESCLVSTASGHGMNKLTSLISDYAMQRIQKHDTQLQTHPIISRSRHRKLLRDCLHHIENYFEYYSHGEVILAAEELRLATKCVGLISGYVTVEDTLDVIFSEFCIGK